MCRARVRRARDSCQDVRAPNSQLGEHCHGDEEAVVSRYSAVGWTAWSQVGRSQVERPEVERSEVERAEVGWQEERAQEVRCTEVGSAEVVPSQIIRTGIGSPEVLGAQALRWPQARAQEAVTSGPRQARRVDGHEAGR